MTLFYHFFFGIYLRRTGLGLWSFIFKQRSLSNSFPRALSLVAVKLSTPEIYFPLFSWVSRLIAFNKAELLIINCLCKSLTFFLLSFLLAWYIRSCKLNTCRLTLFYLMDFQSVVFGFAGSQILTFGVKLIISHQLFKLFFISFFTKYALYKHVVHHSKFGTGFPAKTQLLYWFWYLSILIIILHKFLPMGLSTIDSFSFPLKSHIPYRISFRSHSTYHKESCGL